MALAISSLPVPVSPRISTVVFHFATCRTCSNTRRIGWVWPMMLSKPYCPRTVRRRLSRSSVSARRSRFDVAVEPHALADQVGDHFQEVGVFLQQDFRAGRRLRRQHAGHLAADADRHADERALGIVDAKAVEKARLVGDALDHDGLALLQDHAHHALAGAVADLADVGFVEAVRHRHQQGAGVRFDQADHAALQADAFVQRAQHGAQGFLQIERARQHLADVVQRLQFGLQQFVLELVPVIALRRHEASPSRQGSCTRMRQPV